MDANVSWLLGPQVKSRTICDQMYRINQIKLLGDVIFLIYSNQARLLVTPLKTSDIGPGKKSWS